jgi:nitronate monooxygenase
VRALAHGADGVWVGTRLVASDEAYAHPEWKQRLIVARRHDSVITTMFGPELPCQPYRVLRNQLVKAWLDRDDTICALPRSGPRIGRTTLFPGTTLETPDVPLPAFSAVPPTPDTTGDFKAMGLPAGTSVQRIHAIKPAAQIVMEMIANAQAIMATPGHGAQPPLQ